MCQGLGTVFTGTKNQIRVIETLHPNAAFRTYTCDIMFTKGDGLSTGYTNEKNPSPALVEIFENLLKVPLINELSVQKREIRVGIVEAFENSEKDWTLIKNSVLAGIALFHGELVSNIEITVKDDRKKYDQGEREYISVYGLYEKLEKIAIPQELKIHREKWRNGLLDAKKANMLKAKNCAERDDEESYWDNEIQAFDEAFDALEALKLPEK